MSVVSGVSLAIACIVFAGFCRLKFGLIDWVERQTFAKWFGLLQAPHVFPFAGHSFMLCMGPPQYRQARVLVRGFPSPRAFGFAPMAEYTGSVLIGLGSAASKCESRALDSSFERPSASMSASGFLGSSRMRSHSLVDAHP